MTFYGHGGLKNASNVLVMPKMKSPIRRMGYWSARGKLAYKVGSREDGFALPIALALVILLTVVSAIVTAAVKSHIRAAKNFDSRMHARVLAESALAAVILDLRRAAARPLASSSGDLQPAEPVVCTFDNTGSAAVLVRDSGGRIDLNYAEVPLLEALFAGLGVESGTARQIAAAIEERRTSLAATRTDQRLKRQPPPKPFDTEEAILQIDGVTPKLAAALTPYITVHSAVGGVDLRAADPELLSVLQNGGFALSQFAATRSGRHTFIVTIAARSATGGIFGLEATLRIVRNQQYRMGAEIVSWKPSIFLPGLTPRPGSDGPPCLNVGLFSRM